MHSMCAPRGYTPSQQLKEIFPNKKKKIIKNQSKQTNKNNQARATEQFLTNAIPNTPVLDIYLFAKGTRFKSVAALSGTFLKHIVQGSFIS